ncbi:MAG: peptidase M64, partial [Bacteroidales bacterium]|nr:peptidase M64 [Bacteroidales bacterium]
MKKITTLCLCAAMTLTMQAQNFNDYFENKTLRTDYIFTGDAQKQEVYLDELS